jgi:hypothetical protein
MHHLPVVAFYRLGDEIEILAQAPVRRIFIVASETRISGHIGVQNRGEFAR